MRWYLGLISVTLVGWPSEVYLGLITPCKLLWVTTWYISMKKMEWQKVIFAILTHALNCYGCFSITDKVPNVKIFLLISNTKAFIETLYRLRPLTDPVLCANYRDMNYIIRQSRHKIYQCLMHWNVDAISEKIWKIWMMYYTRLTVDCVIRKVKHWSKYITCTQAT